MRRSLVHVGGTVSMYGDPAAALLLARALDVAPAQRPRPDGPPKSSRDDPDRVHVHGFHAYPARMHPVTAARLVEQLATPGPRGPATVLDPFCGSATVLVEAMIAGRDAVGTDLNPLAVRLASLKTRPWRPAELEGLTRAAHEVARHADDRRARRAGATARLPREDAAAFEPHVLLELDGLRDGIRETKDDASRDALWLVLSAILVKLSRLPGDSNRHPEPTARARHASGYAAKLFARKAEELTRRLADLARLLPSPRPSARVALDDAARLESVPSRSIDAVIGSPPYAGTYDYAAHHAMRLRWLGLDATRLRQHEMGARRRYAPLDGAQAREAWLGELRAMLGATARVLRPGGAAVFLMADSMLAGGHVRADEAVALAAQGTGLEPVARAAQARPDFAPRRARAPGRDRVRREEHALYLRRR